MAEQVPTGGAIKRGKQTMVDTGELKGVLEKLNKEVIPTLNQLVTEVEVIKAKLEEREKSQSRESTQRRDMLSSHERILRGTNDYPGLISDVDDIKDWIKTRSYYEKLLIGGIILQVLGFLFLFVKAAFGV